MNKHGYGLLVKWDNGRVSFYTSKPGHERWSSRGTDAWLSDTRVPHVWYVPHGTIHTLVFLKEIK